MAVLLALGLLAPVTPVFAQTTPIPVELALSGRVAHPRTLALDELRALPPIAVEVAHSPPGASKKPATPGRCCGPCSVPRRQWMTLEKGSHFQHVLLARGQDGYAVASAIGELDPRLENKQVVVAYEQDGKPLPALHLVVPGDAHSARSVRDLVSVEVR